MLTTAAETESWAYWRFRNGREDLGPFGEAVWANIFVSAGMVYIPLKDLPIIGRKGPRMQGNDTVLPDFDVTGRRRCYVDSKCKSRPVVFHKAGEVRHGIDRKSWDAYEAIGGINRQKVALAITELFDHDEQTWSGTLLVQTLGVLGRPSFGMKSQAHMVYWPRKSFRVIASGIPALDLWRASRGEGTIVDATIKAALESFFGKPDPPIQGRMF